MTVVGTMENKDHDRVEIIAVKRDEYPTLADDETLFDDKCISQLKRLRYSTWAVLMAELCERFSYYGIKAGLVLYFTQSLFMSASRGKAWYHVFSSLSYFTGVVGAIIADSWLGKFKTVAISLIAYALFEIILTLTSVPDIGKGNSIGPLFSLIFIAITCGNIKPCLGAFGGDQVNQKDVKLVATFFSMFYMSVNVGATLAMILAPMLRTNIQCYGADCYTAIFGAMSSIMILSAFFFMLGMKGYVKRKPEGNMVVKVTQIIFHALREKRKVANSSENVKDSWLLYADSKYSTKEIADVRGLLKVIVMFIPLPIYWALFHQQGSSWTLQAEQMDGTLGSTELRSDQIQFFNPVLVLILIPIFEILIYPMLEKCGFKLTSLKKMVAGMFLSSIAFVITGLIQMQIQDFQSNPILSTNFSSVDFINSSPCQLLELKYDKISLSIPYGKHSGYHLVKRINNTRFMIIGINCFSKQDIHTSKLDIFFRPNQYLSIFFDINDENKFDFNILEQVFPSVDLKTSNSRVRTIFINSASKSSKVMLKLEHPLFKQRSYMLKNLSSYDGTVRFIQAARYIIKVNHNSSNFISINSNIKFHTFGEYTVLLCRPMHHKYSEYIAINVLEDIKGTSVHRIWQLPQYIVITAGEVLFSVTGLEFAYSQAPQSMKSVLQSFWMLTTAIGDIFVVLISVINPVDDVVNEMFFYGGIMILIMIVFMIMSYFYSYNDYSGNNALSPSENEDVQDEERKML